MIEISKKHDQLSGHLEIIAVPIWNIKSIQREQLESINPSMNFKLECNRESISYSCLVNSSKAGNSFTHKINAFMEGRSISSDYYFNEMLKYHFVVVLQNWDGTYSRIGDQSKGLSFSFDYSTNSQTEAAKGYNLFFYSDTLFLQKHILSIYL